MAGSAVVAVLTKDRPDVLARSLSVLADHHPGIAVVVIDDSAAQSAVEKNRRAIFRAASLGAAHHITGAAVSALCREVDDATGRRGALGPLLSRPTPRDISGLRNLALVASSALRPSTIFCIDDDVVACVPRRGLPCFLDAVSSRHRNRRNAVIGARMGGIADDSYAGRLCRLCESGAGAGAALLGHEGGILPPSAGWRSDRNPLWTEPAVRRPRARRVQHVSGGMMAARIGPRHAVPFPPGYNEDWNWCLLQSMLEGTEVLVDGHPAYHSPPGLHRPDAAGIAWETLGDIMLYSLRRAAAAGARRTLPSLRRRVQRDISGGYAVGEITYTIGLLDELSAGRGRAAARASEHRAELSAAASLLRGMDLRAYAAGWFGMLERRAASLALALDPGGPQDVIRGLVERHSA